MPESFTETFGKAHMESEDSGSSGPKISNQSIAQEAAENKGNDGTLKKNVRYQLSEADELTKLRDEQQRLDEQRRELKEERSAWLGSDAVKEIEAKKKALGIFSAEAKAYRDSEEYQNYLAKRKDYNARMAQLEDQSAVLNGRIKEAGARMQQQNAKKAKQNRRYMMPRPKPTAERRNTAAYWQKNGLARQRTSDEPDTFCRTARCWTLPRMTEPEIPITGRS